MAQHLMEPTLSSLFYFIIIIVITCNENPLSLFPATLWTVSSPVATCSPPSRARCHPVTAPSPASYGVACNTCKNSPTRSLQAVCITSQANLTRYFHTRRPSFESTPQQSVWFLHPRIGRRRLNAPIKWPLSSR